MGEKRVRRTKELKFKVALEAIRGEKQLAEIAAEYHVHPKQVTQWKKELLDKGPVLFATQSERDTKRLEEEREAMIGPEKEVSVSEQYRLLDVPRSSYYRPACGENPMNLAIMHRIDELYTAEPTWGSRKIRDRLRLEGYSVNRKRIQRLMRLMGLQVLYPKRITIRPAPGVKVYLYLLRDLPIKRANQVWCADVTYIRLSHGFVCLVAVLDWHSRKVLSWRLSITADQHFAIEALDEALRRPGDLQHRSGLPIHLPGLPPPSA